MRTGRAILSPLPAAVLALLLTACTVELSAPYYSLEFRGKTAYASPTAASVEFRYSAEESVHRCRLLVTDSLGATVSEQTSDFTAGVWHAAGCDLPAEGRYCLRVVVQVRASDGGYVDLPFLDKSVYLYVDLTDPAAPTIDPAPAISSHPLCVTLEHPELSNPTGSPVTLHYTLDGSDPAVGSPQYSGSPIVLSVSAAPKTLKVIAVDAAERQSDPQTHSFAFMDVSTATPSAISKGTPSHFITLSGYGLGSVTQARLYDSDYEEGTTDGTGVSTAVMGVAADEITIAVLLTTIVEPGTDGTFDAGTGCIRVTDASGETDTIPILINP